MTISNIDFLSIGNACNLTCPGCWYETEENTLGLLKEEENSLMKNIIKNNPESSFFAYPKEITTSPYIIPFFRKIGQKSTLTNGIMLDKIIDNLVESGIETVKVTLFSSQEEQAAFNANSGSQYERIKRNIKSAAEAGLKIQVSNVLGKKTVNSITELAEISSELGADKILFYRLLPLGKNASIENVLMEKDMPDLVNTIEGLKKQYPLRFSMSMTFGPNFYGKTLEEAKEKINKASESWVSSSTLCPSINDQYRGISLKSGNVYWCFLNMTNQELSKIGELDGSKMKITNPVDLTPDTLKEKLRGNCSTDSCQYQELCLGYCRSTAATMAIARNEKNPLYAGMDVCMTKVYETIFGKQ